MDRGPVRQRLAHLCLDISGRACRSNPQCDDKSPALIRSPTPDRQLRPQRNPNRSYVLTPTPSQFMLEPPPRTLPIESGTTRPLTPRAGSAWKFQSRSLPRFMGHLSAIHYGGTLTSPLASRSRTLISLFSARRRATTDPDEPDPQSRIVLSGRPLASPGFALRVPRRRCYHSDSSCSGLAFMSFPVEMREALSTANTPMRSGIAHRAFKTHSLWSHLIRIQMALIWCGSKMFCIGGPIVPLF